MSFSMGQTVRIKHTTLTGVITDAELNKATLLIKYKVEYLDNDGISQSRFFDVDLIEAVA